MHDVSLSNGHVVPPQIIVTCLTADRFERIEIHMASIDVSIRESFGLGDGDCFSPGCKSGIGSKQNATCITRTVTRKWCGAGSSSNRKSVLWK